MSPHKASLAIFKECLLCLGSLMTRHQSRSSRGRKEEEDGSRGWRYLTLWPSISKRMFLCVVRSRR